MKVIQGTWPLRQPRSDRKFSPRAIQWLDAWTTCCYAPIVVLMIILALTAERYGIPFSTYTRDPLAVAHGKSYYGLLSNIGILFWCASAAICLFCSVILRAGNRRVHQLFFQCSGLLTMLLLLDDLFQLHEEVFPVALNIRQRCVLLVYLLATGTILFIYRKIILDYATGYMLAALIFFSISMVTDLLSTASGTWHYFIEDGTKLLGIVSWFSYYVRIAKKEVFACLATQLP